MAKPPSGGSAGAELEQIIYIIMRLSVFLSVRLFVCLSVRNMFVCPSVRPPTQKPPKADFVIEQKPPKVAFPRVIKNTQPLSVFWHVLIRLN